jgi:hypothetical protein
MFSLLSQHAQFGFNDLLDYVWKAPTLLETLEARELGALEGFSNPRDRAWRWAWESRKLRGEFPTFMANSNLFLAVSLFEFQVFRLTRVAQRAAGVARRGRGSSSLFVSLRDLGIAPEHVELWPQVQAATKIRNALTHASGLLVYSSEAGELARIVRSRTYLHPNHRLTVPVDSEYRVSLEHTSSGDVVRLRNEYSWLVVAYARDYFTGLCMAAHKRLDPQRPFEDLLRPTLEIPPALRNRRRRAALPNDR